MTWFFQNISKYIMINIPYQYLCSIPCEIMADVDVYFDNITYEKQVINEKNVKEGQFYLLEMRLKSSEKRIKYLLIICCGLFLLTIGCIIGMFVLVSTGTGKYSTQCLYSEEQCDKVHETVKFERQMSAVSGMKEIFNLVKS